MRMMGMALHVIRTDGFLALYNGLSASLCRQVSAAVPCRPLVPKASTGLLQHCPPRCAAGLKLTGCPSHRAGVAAPSRTQTVIVPLLQMTYSLTRFGIYETAKNHLGQGSQGPPPFYQKVLIGAVGGE